MATVISNPVMARPAQRSRSFDLVLRFGALGLLLSALSAMFGGIWDIQWHTDVGPDTFLTAPHLFVYAGAAGAGLVSLLVTLLGTWQVRQGASPDSTQIAIFGGVFWTPLGFVVAGTGALIFLFFGLFDLWWHTVYGFDAVLDSPPHTGLGLSDLVTLAGGVLVCATLLLRQRRMQQPTLWPTVGLCAMFAIWLINSASWQVGYADQVMGGIDGQFLFISLVYPLVLMMVASIVRRPGIVALTTLVFTLLAGVGWMASAWATPVYAASLGLFVRDNAYGFPVIVYVLPLLLLPAGIAMQLVLSLAQRRQWPVRKGVMLASAVGMPLLVVLEAMAARGVFTLPDAASIAATALVSAGVGALTGWLGWQFGVVLRHITGEGKSAPTQSPAEMAWGRAALVGIVALAAVGIPASVAAHPGGPIVEVHTETIDVGPYRIEVGFSDWPLRAERSLDIVFHAPEGIAGKFGEVTLISPSGLEETSPLVRHPRQREDWGLDIIALPEEGVWTMQLAIDGPLGPGAGSLPLTLGLRPGPPVLVGWLPPLTVITAMVTAIVVAWRRVRPGRQPDTWAWA